MRPNETKIILRSLCQPRCLATEIVTAIVYAAAIFLWMGMLVPSGGRGQAEPLRKQPAPGCTESARAHQLIRALAL